MTEINSEIYLQKIAHHLDGAKGNAMLEERRARKTDNLSLPLPPPSSRSPGAYCSMLSTIDGTGKYSDLNDTTIM
jgi:hypothetical protein